MARVDTSSTSTAPKKIEPRQVQKDLEQGIMYPVYVLVGPERLKRREVIKRIVQKIFGKDQVERGSLESLRIEKYSATEHGVEYVVDSATTVAFGGGIKLVEVRNAEAWKNLEALSPLFPAKSSKKKGDKPTGEVIPTEPDFMVILHFEDWDGRRKGGKALQENACVVNCDAVPERDREAWIGYLAKVQGLTLDAESLATLRTMEPWSLERIETEIEKWKTALGASEGTRLLTAEALWSISSDSEKAGKIFLEALFSRDFPGALAQLPLFVREPEIALPLQGLIAWNSRQLMTRPESRRRNPFLEDRFRRWAPKWKVDDWVLFSETLSDLDFSLKQTARDPLGLWSEWLFRLQRRY